MVFSPLRCLGLRKQSHFVWFCSQYWMPYVLASYSIVWTKRFFEIWRFQLAFQWPSQPLNSNWWLNNARALWRFHDWPISNRLPQNLSSMRMNNLWFRWHLKLLLKIHSGKWNASKWNESLVTLSWYERNAPFIFISDIAQ